MEHFLIALTRILHDGHVLHGLMLKSPFPKEQSPFSEESSFKNGMFQKKIMVVLFFETSIVMFHDVSKKKKRVFHAGPCSSITCSIAGALSREIFWVMGCNGTSSRAAVLLARNSKSSIVEAPGKKSRPQKEIRSEIRDG